MNKKDKVKHILTFVFVIGLFLLVACIDKPIEQEDYKQEALITRQININSKK